jgi:hypothetical protein
VFVGFDLFVEKQTDYHCSGGYLQHHPEAKERSYGCERNQNQNGNKHYI